MLVGTWQIFGLEKRRKSSQIRQVFGLEKRRKSSQIIIYYCSSCYLFRALLYLSSGGGERADPRAAAHDVLHGVPRLLPRGLPLLREAGPPLLHPDQDRHLALARGRCSGQSDGHQHAGPALACPCPVLACRFSASAPCPALACRSSASMPVQR
jgi:hypothetical protein